MSATNAPAIRTAGLTKRYGDRPALNGVDLEVARGEVFGFLGPNGAGKTTTIRLLLDLIRPTAGRAQVLGLDSRRNSVQIRRRVGYLPGEPALYGDLTGQETLTYLGSLRGGVDAVRIEELAERLGADLSRRVRELSAGNKQKVGLIQAFMHRPELLILDEPTNGLDPLVQQTFHALVLAAKAQGQTVFLSSHVLSEVERIADRVGIIRAGRLVQVDAVQTIKAKALRHLEFEFACPAPTEAFEGLPGVHEVRVNGPHATIAVEGSMDAVVKAAARFEVISVVSREPNLEDAFLALYREEAADAA
jgi:ABC-2 type transport system ATP-binding protein